MWLTKIQNSPSGQSSFESHPGKIYRGCYVVSRGADPAGFYQNPHPAFEKNPDPYPTFQKKNGSEPDLRKKPDPNPTFEKRQNFDNRIREATKRGAG